MRGITVVGVIGLFCINSWGFGNFGSGTIKGKVRTMYMDADRPVVRVEDPQDSNKVTTFRLCHLDPMGTDANGRVNNNSDMAAQMYLDPSVSVFKNAMENGLIVEVQFKSSVFGSGGFFEPGPGACIYGTPRIVDPEAAKIVGKPTNNGTI